MDDVRMAVPLCRARLEPEPEPGGAFLAALHLHVPKCGPDCTVIVPIIIRVGAAPFLVLSRSFEVGSVHVHAHADGRTGLIHNAR